MSTQADIEKVFSDLAFPQGGLLGGDYDSAKTAADARAVVADITPGGGIDQLRGEGWNVLQAFADEGQTHPTPETDAAGNFLQQWAELASGATTKAQATKFASQAATQAARQEKEDSNTVSLANLTGLHPLNWFDTNLWPTLRAFAWWIIAVLGLLLALVFAIKHERSDT